MGKNSKTRSLWAQKKKQCKKRKEHRLTTRDFIGPIHAPRICIPETEGTASTTGNTAEIYDYTTVSSKQATLGGNGKENPPLSSTPPLVLVQSSTHLLQLGIAESQIYEQRNRQKHVIQLQWSTAWAYKTPRQSACSMRHGLSGIPITHIHCHIWP